MGKKIKIKPAEGFRVKKPDGDFLKESGEFMEQGTYWARRLKFGEVVLCKSAEQAEKPVEVKEVDEETQEDIEEEIEEQVEEAEEAKQAVKKKVSKKKKKKGAK